MGESRYTTTIRGERDLRLNYRLEEVLSAECWVLSPARPVLYSAPSTMSRILIIDDEPAIRTSLSHILSDEGHRTTLCESGEEGLAQLAREEFDLIILDL